MLPWFASAFLILSYSFTGLSPWDVSVDSGEVIWVLSALEPTVTRLYPGGERVDVQLDMEGLPGGLAVSPTGRWAVSCPASGAVLIYDRDDILVQEVPAENPGDVIFSGLELFVVDTASGSIGVPGGVTIARDCAGRNSTISTGGRGRILISGSRGVFLVEQGATTVQVASSGAGCITPGRIVLLQNGTVFSLDGDTLYTGVEGSRIASSPSGATLVVWGGSAPSVLE